MTDAEDDLDLLGELVESFLQRWRRGEAPAVEEYARRHPRLAAQLRDALGALVLLEDLGGANGRSDPEADPPAGG